MTDLLEHIRSRTAEEGSCWIWRLGVDAGGYPQMSVKGYACKSVRRLALIAVGRPPAPRMPVTAKCNCKTCVNPDHLVQSTTKVIAVAAAKRGAFSRPDRAAKIAAAKRPLGKLTMDKAREIRLRTEPAHVLGPIYGVDKSLITRIRAGKCWREYSSPFAGLLR